MKIEYRGDILAVRAIEDCIRATKKYTKGAFRKESPKPETHIQGSNFPSRVCTEYYEVYPDVELSWDMPASKLWELAWGTHIDVRFQYDYRQNSAKVVIYDAPKSVEQLCREIPGLSETLDKVKEEFKRTAYGEHDSQEQKQEELQVVGSDNRIRTSPVPHTQ